MNCYRNKKLWNDCPIKILVIALLFWRGCTDCNTDNSLTQSENVEYAEFVTAKQLESTQQTALRQAYTAISRQLSDTYSVEIDTTYKFNINDVDSCSNFPDYVTFNAFDDAWVCMENQVQILKCNKQWELKIGCGTFIQLHRPFDGEIMASEYLDSQEIKSSFNIALKGVCAGTYHFWFIYSTRVGKIIKYVRPIFISYPSCTC